MADEMHAQSGGISSEEHAELSTQLKKVTGELEEIARRRLRRLPNSWSLAVTRRADELEEQADTLRTQLHQPRAIGRPPRSTWVGWVVLIATVVTVFGVLAVVTTQAPV